MNIVDHLYLGSAAHAAQCELLERLGITALLNVSPNCPNYWPEKFEYETIPVEDNSTADIKIHFRRAIDFINDVKSRGGKVLVHCKAGVSRSATLCLAYLISCRKMCLNDAYDQVKVTPLILNLINWRILYGMHNSNAFIFKNKIQTIIIVLFKLFKIRQ